MLIITSPGDNQLRVTLDDSHRLYDHKLPDGVTEDQIEVYSVYIGRDGQPAIGCGPCCLKRAVQAVEPAPAVDAAPAVGAAAAVVVAPAVEPAPVQETPADAPFADAPFADVPFADAPAAGTDVPAAAATNAATNAADVAAASDPAVVMPHARHRRK